MRFLLRWLFVAVSLYTGKVSHPIIRFAFVVVSSLAVTRRWTGGSVRGFSLLLLLQARA